MTGARVTIADGQPLRRGRRPVCGLGVIVKIVSLLSIDVFNSRNVGTENSQKKSIVSGVDAIHCLRYATAVRSVTFIGGLLPASAS